MSEVEWRKELIVVRLNHLVSDAFPDSNIELVVNVLPNGKPMENDRGEIHSVGFFLCNLMCHYICVKDDTPAKMFLRCSQCLYEMTKNG